VICIRCGKGEASVMDTRNRVAPSPYVYRHRTCDECGHKFQTIEIPIDTISGVVTIPVMGLPKGKRPASGVPILIVDPPEK